MLPKRECGRLSAWGPAVKVKRRELAGGAFGCHSGPPLSRLALSLIPAPLIAVCAASLSLLPADGTHAATKKAAPERRLILLYTGEVHGAIEPCGCTSDPLGDISRYAEVVRQTRADAKKDGGAVLLVDAGNLLYPEGVIAARERPADELRAGFLAAELGKLGLVGAALGETDLSGGSGLVAPKRLAANLGPSPVLEPASVRTIGGVKVGLLGVADPALGETLKVKTEDPVVAARREAERLRREGAEVVVVLAAVDKAIARRVAREAPVDFVVLGRQVRGGSARAEPVGRAFLLTPADELQRVGRVDLVLRATADTGFVDAEGAEGRAARKDEIDRALRRLDDELAKWAKEAKEAGADASFVAAKRRERDELAAEQHKVAAPWSPPATGSYFINRLIPLRRTLPRDATMVAAIKRLDTRIATVNLKNATPPPPPEPGRASYVGVSSCGGCHKGAVAFWKKTVHARAWETLVKGGKQADYKCVGCHLTGYGQVGGSTLGHARGLTDVQCENCHGPASKHVAEKGLEEPSSVHRATPETTCLACHNEHHSDTFQYEAYLRDILGPGHGEAARKKLGDGPTGHGLRAAAVAKAKAEGAKQAQARESGTATGATPSR